MSLLQMSFSGAILILTTVLVRAVALHRLPKRALLVLWEIVLARLLVPYVLPAAFSFYSLWARIAPAAQPPRPVPSVRPFTAPPVGMEPALVPAPAPAAAPDPGVDLWHIVWLAGVAVCAVFFVAAYCKCCREFRASLPVEHDGINRWLGEHRLRRRLSVRQSDRIHAPLTYHVLRPVILLPKSMNLADGEALRYVLAHELVHIRRFDAVRKLLLTAAVCVHWFNPMVWVMYVLANRDIEISCDETVIFKFAGGTRASYAQALLRMEEHKSGFAPLCSNFSRNAIEERIVAIMKMKKTSAVAILAAAVLITGTGAAFATSAAEPSKEKIDRALNAVTVQETELMMSYTDPNSGTAYYSTDGGKTFTPLTDEEFEALYPTPQVEWWTYDEYKAWLENEKTQLQAMLGETGWTGGRGEFVWTQEVIDETIAMYEQTLEDIKNGYLVSKTVDGSDDVVLMVGTGDRIAGTHEADVMVGNEIPPMEEYEPFGLTLNEAENALYYNGEKVRYFEDSVDVSENGDGALASRCQYYREDGSVSLRTVREAVQNPDGSTNPFGPIVRMETLSAREAEKRIEDCLNVNFKEAVACEIPELEYQIADNEEVLKVYAPFGLEYRFHPVTGEFRMAYAGKPVHSLSDSVTGVWIANNMHGTDLPPDAIDLEAVYENGTLAGLRESDVPHSVQHQVAEATAGSSEEAGEGTPLPEMFDKYAPFGISYEEKETPDGKEYSLYLNGEFVNFFSDLKPDGSVFSFGSTRQTAGGLEVYTVYENGKLVGITQS